jgi:FkbM family methyltransferase
MSAFDSVIPLRRAIRTDFIGSLVRNDYGLGRNFGSVRAILDIGANVGFFSLAARAIYPDAVIHAYEPNSRIFPFLESNTAGQRIVLHPEALGSECGTVAMHDDGDSNQARTIQSPTGTVPQVTLATAIQRIGGAVDLLKVDCEGAEWSLFTRKRYWSAIRHVSMEYHLLPGYSRQDVKDALTGLGFEITHWKVDVNFGLVWASRSDA